MASENQNPSVSLTPALSGQLSEAETTSLYQKFLKVEQEKIKKMHRHGSGGVEVCKALSSVIDTLLKTVFTATVKAQGMEDSPVALIAIGGYGRGILNPGSDIDLLILLPRASSKLPQKITDLVQKILYPIWDVGFKVGHSCRSVNECINESRADQQNFTALMDTRLLAGNKELYKKLVVKFEKQCIGRGREAFLEGRRIDLRSRYKKSYDTVFLQEPNVKESCGGLRDYQNIQWIARMETGSSDLNHLVKKNIITATTKQEIDEAYNFLLHVRNELHYHSRRSTDILTLQLQGVVATAFDYPQKSILHRTEFFMRDYYRHTRHLHRHNGSLMETFQIAQDDVAESGFVSFLTLRRKKREEFDGFIAIGNRIHPKNSEIFTQDPHRLMRLFQHCQLRGLRLSPPMRRLIANHWQTIDEPFRYLKANRDTFQAILERKGQVAKALRQMHRIGFLGRYLPEFGALDCLVQHEFFHRYTADEHTLRCIDELDKLIENDDPRFKVFRNIFYDIVDPYAMYIALILHDTGRSEDVREHIDGSAMLAAQLCNRLKIQGHRRSMIMFLVDNHLTFWRTATTKNLEDPAVIEEFAAVMKTPENLDALLLFTYCDTNGTAPDAWNGWKESLMLQLHRATKLFLQKGRKGFDQQMNSDRDDLLKEVIVLLPAAKETAIHEHFEKTPQNAFAYREPKFVASQIEAIESFLQKEAIGEEGFPFSLSWLDYPGKGYTELILASRDKALLLEKLCCALAAVDVNILSADLFSRSDGIVVNIFRICTTNFEPCSDVKKRKKLTKTFKKMLTTESYEPAKYLKPKTNFLKPQKIQGELPVPVRAQVSNEKHPKCTTLEVQALDRIGLLHDLFQVINEEGLDTKHARICTEKGVAMDTLYIRTQNGDKVTDPNTLARLEQKFGKLINIAEN